MNVNVARDLLPCWCGGAAVPPARRPARHRCARPLAALQTTHQTVGALLGCQYNYQVGGEGFSLVFRPLYARIYLGVCMQTVGGAGRGRVIRRAGGERGACS